MIIAIILVTILVIILIWGVSCYNTLIRLRNNAEESYSTMDVFLKKRYDLIPNLVETVKGFATHEKETLEAVIKARNLASNSVNPDEKLKNEGQLTNALKSLLVVTEKYPELQANTNFLDLQNQLKNLEQEISNARRLYNANVKAYNIKIEIFPSVIIANMFKFVKKPLYEVDNAEERKNVKVEF